MCDKLDPPSHEEHTNYGRISGEAKQATDGEARNIPFLKEAKQPLFWAIQSRLAALEVEANNHGKAQRLYHLARKNPEIIEMIDLMLDLGFLRR